MASIHKRKTPGGLTRFDVRWRPTPDAAERSKTFPTLETAKSYRGQLEA
jgi:hypothetical protein